jgi:hypothetical protein
MMPDPASNQRREDSLRIGRTRACTRRCSMITKLKILREPKTTLSQGKDAEILLFDLP